MDEHLRAPRTSRTPLWVAALVLLAGCESLGTTKKFSNPVVPPPPRERLISREPERNEPGTRFATDGETSDDDNTGTGHASLAANEPDDADRTQRAPRGRVAARNPGKRKTAPTREADDSESDDDSAVSQISGSDEADGWRPNAPYSKGERSNTRKRSRASDLTSYQSSTATEGAGKIVDPGEVAALVNGVPIFYEDVLMPFAAGLAQYEKQLPPEEFRRQRNALVEKHIQPHIEQELLLQKLRAKLKDEQLAQIKKHIDTQFDEELRDTMKKVGVSTPGELEVQLRKSRSSIDTLRTNFRNRHLAQQYLATRASPKTGFDRPEIYEHFQNNKEKFAIPGRVKWQQIHLLYAKHGGKPGTKKLANELIARLEDGEDFANLAREFSDGPTAKNGGFWPWTVESSLKSKELDEALFGMPIGEELARIDGADAIDIVVVLDRQAAGFKTFASVQTDIKNELKSAEFHRTVKQLLAELAEGATIEKYTGQ